MTTLRWDTPERHESIGSTNAEALLDPRPGRVIVAEHQSAGQGRRGRSWESPPGAGMAISTVVPSVSPQAMGWLPLAAGVALASALEQSRWAVTAGLKWPNDVLVPLAAGQGAEGQRAVLEADGARWGKIAGILTQVAAATGTASGTGAGAVVIGTGVNIDHTPEQLPVPTATSWRLARGGAPVPQEVREVLLTTYLEELARLHQHLAEGDVEAVRTAYLARCLTLDRRVTIHLPDGSTRDGTAVGIDASGALVLDGADGRRVHHAGDVEHARPAAEGPR